MNAEQYRVVKSVHACGASPKKFAKMIGVDEQDILLVKNTFDYKQYSEVKSSKDTDELMKKFFGGMF